MIRLTDIAKTYAMGDTAVHALRGVSLTVGAGEFVAIMGPSGSGKSTLMHILGLLDVPDSGSYRLLDQEVACLPDNRLAVLRGQSIGFVFQHFNLLSRTSALENTLLPLIYSAPRADREAARRRLEEVGLGDRLHHRPNELSGGQQQRVAIARALIHQPRLILADEPTGNLDSVSANEILDIFDRLNQAGLTIILVTHEPDIAARARRIVRMKDGRILSDETARPLPPGPVTPPYAPTAYGRPLWRELPHHLKQAGRALLANKVRSILSMLGILIGVTAVIAMLAIATGARQAIEASLSSLGSNMLVLRAGASRQGGVSLGAGTITRFTLDDAAEIQARIPYARRVSGIVAGRAQATYANRNWNTQAQGVAPAYALMYASVPIAGRFFTDDEMRSRSRVAVIGLTLVRELFGGANPVGETIKLNKVAFQVIGVLPEKGANAFHDQDDIVLIPVTTAMFRLLGRQFVDNIGIEVRQQNEIEVAQGAVSNLVMSVHRLPPSQGNSFEVRNLAEIQAMLTASSRTMAWLLSSIAAVSLLVGGIGIMNIMLVSVTERTKEIGLRKAIGARRRDVLAQFLTEAVVISLGGGAGHWVGLAHQQGGLVPGRLAHRGEPAFHSARRWVLRRHRHRLRPLARQQGRPP